MNYIPLGIKTDYSLLNSLIKIDSLIEISQKYNFNALGILDNNLFGCVELFLKCQKNNIKPIIGLDIKYQEFNIYLYPTNYEGLLNLFLIHDLIFEKTITINDLTLYNQNLLLVLPFDSYNLYNEFKNIFAHIYLAYKNEQEKISALVISNNIVYLNETMFLNKEDKDLINYLKMIEKDKNIESYQMLNYANNYLIEPEKINEFDINTTILFSNLINLNWPTTKNVLPKYQSNVKDNYKFLSNLSIKGLNKRLNNQVPDKYKERLTYELNIINKMGFVDYFLIVYDYVLYAKKNNIFVGPGRGSAAGSLVSYSLGITNIDPIKYNLLFERFLNVDRVTMPDIDLDFEDSKRDDIKKYLINKYGSDKVASIITFSTLGSKQVLRDVINIFNYQDQNLNAFLKEINPNINLKKNYNTNLKLQKIIENNPKIKNIYFISMKLEGLKKLISTHAAGIVISNQNLNELIPMYKTTNTYLTGITMDYLEEMGLLKMDLLALNNLTIIHKCLDLLDNNFDLNKIPLDDIKTYDLFSKGETSYVFQFESEGMKNFLIKLKPTKFSDLYAAVALYRPGPMDNIDLFVERKNKTKKIDYLHPDLEEILKETYGIIIYQEQIIQILTKMAGFTLSESDLVRKSMSKKNFNDLILQKDKFIKGCLNNNYDLIISNKVFDLILKFAAYGFNKSHSVSYALISYQLAYLKTNYPKEFFTTLLNLSIGSSNKIKEYLASVIHAGIKINKFDLYKSKEIFYLENSIIYIPLTIIKGITILDYEKIQNILKEEIIDIFKFVNLWISNQLDKDKLTNIIKVGVLDHFGYNRQTLLINLENILNYTELLDNENPDLITKPLIEIVPEMANNELLKNEILLCGFYISNHPTNEHYKNNMVKVNMIKNYFDKFIEIVVIVNRIKTIKTKKNEDMAFITGSDETGDIEFILFPKNINLLKSINENKIIIISGKVTRKNDKYGIIINKIINTGE